MKKITHAIAVLVLAIAGFFATSAGQGVVKQYPRIAPFAAAFATIAALYFSPKSPPGS